MTKITSTILALCVITEGCATERLYVHVDDELGRPVSNAVVKLGTMNKVVPFGSDRAKDYDHYEAITDTNGNAVVEFNCKNGCFGWGVWASNCYSSASYNDEFKGEELFPIPKSFLHEHEKHVTAIVWRKRNPQPMFVWSARERRKSPMGLGRFGFDLKAFDWLPPFGCGKIADFYFNKIKGADFDEGEIVGNIEFEEGNGAYVMKKNDYKAFPTAYEANPSALYETNFISKGYLKAGYLLRTNYISKDEYMVVRTRAKMDGQGKIISAHYAKIFGPFSVGDKFIVANEVVFNPNVNDPNLEFDVRKNLNPDCKETWLYP